MVWRATPLARAFPWDTRHGEPVKRRAYVCSNIYVFVTMRSAVMHVCIHTYMHGSHTQAAKQPPLSSLCFGPQP